MGWWLLRLLAKISALLRLSVNFFQLQLTKKLKINFFCFKELKDNNGLLAKTFKKFSNSPLRLAGSHFLAKFAVRAVNV